MKIAYIIHTRVVKSTDVSGVGFISACNDDDGYNAKYANNSNTSAAVIVMIAFT